MPLYPALKPLLFCLPPETAHNAAHRLGRIVGGVSPLLGLLKGIYDVQDEALETEFCGLRIPNPVGLAAGFDKDGVNIDFLGALGFGFLEIGTITPRPQKGNPKPRMFRIPDANALINRMGFNNGGVDALVENVKRAKYRGVLGINIGKNKDTPLEESANDYLICLEKVFPYASYIAVNVSSPNTPGLRQLQNKDELNRLLEALKERYRELTEEHQKKPPLLLKIAPDLHPDDIRDVASVVGAQSIDAVIATNTTSTRDAVKGLEHADEAGGLSGAPLTEMSTNVIAALRDALPDSVPIVGVGGVKNAADTVGKLQAGASAVQLYTSLVYEGPAVCKNINRGLLKHLRENNLSSLDELAASAVGSDSKRRTVSE